MASGSNSLVAGFGAPGATIAFGPSRKRYASRIESFVQLTIWRSMQPIARAIAVLLMLAFGFSVPVVAAQGMAMGDHVAVAEEHIGASAGCVDCQGEHSAMSASSCVSGCVGAVATGATADVGREIFPRSFPVALDMRLTHWLISPEPYPPRTSA